MQYGSRYVVKRGFGWNSDITVTESEGKLEKARPDFLSERAFERGANQCGTLGSGNHFLEVQVVEKIFDEKAAQIFGLVPGNLTIMIHSGSRGLGYQVCDDYIGIFQKHSRKHDIQLPDPQLICAPLHSEEGQRYLGAMRAAANFAWANRQIMTHLTRGVFEQVFQQSAESLGMHLVYDVAHNIAKVEPYEIKGEVKKLCVHRKGATRAFPAGHAEVPEQYRSIGQPVIIPGDMGRHSYVLVGQPGAMTESFGSSCHGAGRCLSRRAAIRSSKGRNIREELLAAGVIARAKGRTGLDEEQPSAYKDVNDVVDVVEKAGLCKIVARLKPVGVIKG